MDHTPPPRIRRIEAPAAPPAPPAPPAAPPGAPGRRRRAAWQPDGPGPHPAVRRRLDFGLPPADPGRRRRRVRCKNR